MRAGCCSTRKPRARRGPASRPRNTQQRLRTNRSRKARMSLASKTLKLCSCNGTIALDAKRLAGALKTGQPIQVHRELCRKEAGAYSAVLGEADVLVACTQEAALFAELAASASSQAKLGFFNIREAAGWSAEGAQAGPKIAALIAAAALPEPEPVPEVSYQSGGEL